MAFIYEIYNDFDNNIYIGQTSNTIQYRFWEHCYKTQEYSYIDKAIRKHGKEHYFVKMIEECCAEEILEREQFWIEYFHCCVLDPLYVYGYNLTFGGEGVLKYSKTDFLQYWEQGYSIADIAKLLNCDRGTVTKRLNISKDEKEKRRRESISKKLSRKIYQFDLNGNFIKEFPSGSEAARQLGINDNSNIIAACKGRRRTAYGFIWLEEKNEIVAKEKALIIIKQKK